MHFAIVRVIQGENFPSEGGQLRFITKWGQQEATLQSVFSSSSVPIHQEVAFETAKNDERILKLEQMYLQCTYTSHDGTFFDFGNVDLSFNFTKKSKKKWYTLEYALENLPKEPSLLISTFWERNEETSARLETKSAVVSSPENHPTDFLKPILVNDDYFLIESPRDTGEYEQVFFKMSVTLSFAENLLYLFPSKSLWPPENMPFDFRFNLFGSPIRFAPFHSLRNLTEIGERATAKIKGTPKCVLRFLKHSMQTLTILLCCEDIPIAQSIIPIKERIEHHQLESHILGRLHLEPVNITGIFPMSSLLEAGMNELNSPILTPQIGVVVTLSQIEEETTTQQASNQSYPSPTLHSIHSSIVSSEPMQPSSVINSSSSKKKQNGEKNQQDLMYATALELEVWKEEQKLLEKEKLERSRASYMELLNSEYRQQAAVKEAVFQRRVRHVEELEKQLENAIQSTRRTEMELQQEKEYLSRQRSQLKREKNLVASEIERVTQGRDARHKFELEAERRRHTEIVLELRRKLKAQLQKSTEDRRRITELEEELNNLKHGNNS